jgi:hypothetical protein
VNGEKQTEQFDAGNDPFWHSSCGPIPEEGSLPNRGTHQEKSIEPIGWSSDGGHVIATESSDTGKVYSVPAVGGEPDLIMSADKPGQR